MGNLMRSLWSENGRSNQLQARKRWILWDNTIKVIIVRMSDRFIIVKVLEESMEFLITFVYAKCNYGLHRQLWRDLEEDVQNNLPWMILVDFNIIRSDDERKGGAPRPLIAMKEFNTWISRYGLLEINFQGKSLSSYNGQEGLARSWARLSWSGFL